MALVETTIDDQIDQAFGQIKESPAGGSPRLSVIAIGRRRSVWFLLVGVGGGGGGGVTKRGRGRGRPLLEEVIGKRGWKTLSSSILLGEGRGGKVRPWYSLNAHVWRKLFS